VCRQCSGRSTPETGGGGVPKIGGSILWRRGPAGPDAVAANEHHDRSNLIRSPPLPRCGAKDAARHAMQAGRQRPEWAVSPAWCPRRAHLRGQRNGNWRHGNETKEAKGAAKDDPHSAAWSRRPSAGREMSERQYALSDEEVFRRAVTRGTSAVDRGRAGRAGRVRGSPERARRSPRLGLIGSCSSMPKPVPEACTPSPQLDSQEKWGGHGHQGA